MRGGRQRFFWEVGLQVGRVGDVGYESEITAGKHRFFEHLGDVPLPFDIHALSATGAAIATRVPVAFFAAVGGFVEFEDVGAALPAFGDVEQRVARGTLVKVFCAFNQGQAMTAFRAFVHFPPLPSEKARERQKLP
jgi:hypothetical protein